MKFHPLRGKTVLVTRGKEQAQAFSDKLRQVGAIPIEIPLISFSASEHNEQIGQCIRELYRYDWLIFTSANGVRFFFPLIKPGMKLPKVAVVGKKTATALEKHGIQPDIVPDEFVAEGLVEALKPIIQPNERILLVKGNLARPTLKEALIRIGATVTDLVVYETKINESGKEQLIDLLQKRAIDVITFTSSSTVQSFMRMLDEVDWVPLLEQCVIACIGPVTKQAAEKAGLRVHICPERYTIDDMIKEMGTYFS
ncbi:uroporphyrinogen-III synthase [Thermaerobacillus caldiproteolyticus]|uniref:uroporphyrinogen-III synthase n=1 Tax=Thermaerobacillus caldiproteolyticus TaxID=247480 RepID=UPI00188ADF7E|nr:uroporphyrinogen-III synthase [Anoxybacillus caldiproteolyticus]QPA30255.1 uroporphyrinogen-III synthase [Anoxybacillus caldiproteolyticus]